jgi:hypothetical protein
MADKPFVLLGVNSDSSREIVKEAKAKENLTWRSFWNGGSTGGPISRAWNVQGWPTLFIIDHKGVIRHVYPGVPNDLAAFDRQIEALVQEADHG